MTPMESNQKKPSDPEKALLSVVVPIYNEAFTLSDLLAELMPFCRERNWKLILVNDGSSDNTSAILKQIPLTP
jgi:glycosyltransferase involved in cell wall biosynthesis